MHFYRYAIISSAYRFVVHKFEISDIHVNKIIESRDDELFESVFPNKRDTPENIKEWKSDDAFERKK